MNSIEKEEPFYRWQVTLTADQIQTLAGADITDQTGEIEKVRITKRGNSGIARNMVLYGKQSSVTIEGQMEIRELLCSPDVVIRKQDGSETSGFDLLPSAYFYITQDKEGNYQLHGGGFGHGVGMSQNGANDLAEAGYGYEEILSHYYNGTELEKLRRRQKMLKNLRHQNKVNRVKEKIEWIQNLTVVRMVQGAMRINKDNQLSAFAAQAAFFLLLSFFPFAMMLLIGIRFLPVTQAEFIELVAEMIPGKMAETLSFMVDEIYSTQVGTTMIVSAVVAVWSAAKGTMAIERGLNFMDRTKDTKNYILRRLTNALYTLIFCVMLIALVGVYVLGNTIMEDILAKTNWVDYSEKIFFYSRLLTAPVLVFAVILLIYCRLPDNHLRLKTAIPGAVFTTVCWVLLSAAFSSYLTYFGINTYMYGNLGGMVIAMLWLYICMYILLLGAELNLFFRDEIWAVFRKIHTDLHKKRTKKD